MVPDRDQVLDAVVGDVPGDLSDVCGLVADALHVRDHLQGGGDGAQIPGHRLLLEQQLHTQAFDVPLLLVDVPLRGQHGLPQAGIAVQQGLGRAGDDLLAQGTHGDKFYVEPLQLCFKFDSHYPNLPVM